MEDFMDDEHTLVFMPRKKGQAMKIAVFSDVHGKLRALKAVLEQIYEKNVDLTVFLGDMGMRTKTWTS